MSKSFEFKLKKKSVKLNLETKNFNKITLKFCGIYGCDKTVFTAKVCIKLDPKNTKKIIKSVDIVDIEVNKCEYDELSHYSYRDIYRLPIDTSSSSSICDDVIYDEVMCFIKNIKFLIENNKLCSMIFTLKNTDIRKIKVKGKIN